MVSRLFSTSFDEDVDKATSELIPKDHDDITLYLEISDQIRSKSVSAKDAMRALKRRITHSNPNVQLLALSLLDTCVKNGGHHFLIEVASREFVDSLTSIVRSPPTNPEVRVKLLGLIQTWALAFEGKPELALVTETYRLLKSEGSVFPKIDKTSSVMIDTATAPVWTDSETCTRCRDAFTMFNRKHHCRNCGQTFCGSCSSKTTTLPHFGIVDQVRVCDSCFVKRQVRAKSVSVDFTNSKSSSSTGFAAPPTLYSTSSFNDSYNSSSNNNSIISTTAQNDQEDEELKKAIELSLKEAESKNHFQPSQQKVAKTTEPVDSKQEEDDLAAAIEASLREMNIKQSHKSYAQQSYHTTNIAPAYTPHNSKLSNLYELSTIEAENIYQFSELLEKIQQNGGDLMRDRQVQELYDRIGELKPKLTKNLAETIQKHQDLVDMHEKLAQVVKTYDRLLEERMSNAYSRRVTQRLSIAPSSGTTYPTITTNAHTSSIYTQSPSYPVASAPAPSPTYYPSQTAPPSQQYVPPQSNESAPIVNQQVFPPPQQVQPQQQAQPQQPQSSYASYAYASTHLSYAPNPPNPNENAVNTTGTLNEYCSNTAINQQGYKTQTNGIVSSVSSYIPQTNGIAGSSSTSYNPHINGTSSNPQSNDAYAPSATYGYQAQLQQQQAPPPQQNYYQYQTSPTSQQIIPPAQPHIEEALLIEL